MICCSISSLYKLSAFFCVTVTSWISSDLKMKTGQEEEEGEEKRPNDGGGRDGKCNTHFSSDFRM